jgi:hypothetical protein
MLANLPVLSALWTNYGPYAAVRIPQPGSILDSALGFGTLKQQELLPLYKISVPVCLKLFKLRQLRYVHTSN